VRRHIGPSPRDISAMLETVGASSLKALMAETLPQPIRQKAPLDLGNPQRNEALVHMRDLASKNQVFTSLIAKVIPARFAGGDPAQHPGESGLVHGLYALSAGDQSRAGWKPC